MRPGATLYAPHETAGRWTGTRDRLAAPATARQGDGRAQDAADADAVAAFNKMTEPEDSGVWDPTTGPTT